MITTSLNPLTEEYKLLNPSSDTLLMSDTTTATLYNNNNNNNNNNGIIVDNATVVPDLLTENSGSKNSSSGPSSAEEAVFLPTYATLPTTKLEEEPNPFEQSFEATAKEQITLPSVNTIDNPTNLNVGWDSLRSGILSPSMLPGPTPTTTTTAAPVVRRPVKYEVNTTTFYNHTYENPPPTVNRNNVKHTRKYSNSSESSSVIIPTKKQRTNNKSKVTKESSLDPEDEEKRKNFLERNRIAALKCRQRKKQWLQNLQTKVEYLAADNEQFHMQANALREELINLKTLLMAHKDCPISQQELKLALSRPIPGVPNLPHLLSEDNNNNN